MCDFATMAERPRVLHVAQSVAGGIASYFEEIADYQTQTFGRGNVAFVVPQGAERFARLDPQQLICFRSAARHPSALLDFARTAGDAIHRLRPDIVHLHSSFAGAIVRSMLARRRSPRPAIVYCPHGWAFGMEASSFKQASYAFAERRLAGMTDTIHVNSRSEHELGARFGVPAEKMQIVWNGIGWAPPAAREARSGRIRIAFIGRHDRQKGLDILLDTIRRFPLGHLQFDIVGDRVLAPQSRDSGAVDANVTFHGWLSRQDIFTLLDKVDAVVMPSRWEAFGLVAIEAMRAGVPVIASNRGALPEIVQDGITGFIFNLDDDNALGALLSRIDRPRLEALGRASRDRWERNYRSERMNGSIADSYAQVLHRTQGVPQGGEVASRTAARSPGSPR